MFFCNRENHISNSVARSQTYLAIPYLSMSRSHFNRLFYPSYDRHPVQRRQISLPFFFLLGPGLTSFPHNRCLIFKNTTRRDYATRLREREGRVRMTFSTIYCRPCQFAITLVEESIKLVGDLLALHQSNYGL